MASDFKMICDSMNSPPAILIVSPQQFDSGTAQTPGSERRAAIAPSLGIASTIWGGLFEVEPGSRTGVHHHGEQETIAYVVSGICEIRWGAKGECRAREGWRLHSRPPPSCCIWKSTLRNSNRFDGSWCAAQQHRSYSTFRTTPRCKPDVLRRAASTELANMEQPWKRMNPLQSRSPGAR